jgi:putative PIN family toxin of toxin-antitoxin system
MRPGSFLDVELRRLVEARFVDLFVSQEILLELRRKAEDKFGFSAKESLDLMAVCRSLCSIVEPSQRVNVIVRDPDDNKILECAVEAKADIIVSADKDLLKLKKYEDTQIVHPSMLKYWFKPKA